MRHRTPPDRHACGGNDHPDDTGRGPLPPDVTPKAVALSDPGAGAVPPALARSQAFIIEAARRFDVPIDWIAAVMAAESGSQTMRNGHPLVSRAGAMGLMQVMPATWATMRARLRLSGFVRCL